MLHTTTDDFLDPRPRLTVCMGDGTGDGGAGTGVDGVGVGSGVGNNTSQGNAGNVGPADTTGVNVGSQTPGVAGPAGVAEGAASAAAAAAAAAQAQQDVINAILGRTPSMQNMMDIDEVETGPQSVAPGPQSHTGIGVVDNAINAMINPTVPQLAVTVPAAIAAMFSPSPISPGIANVVANVIGQGLHAITGSTNEGAQAAIDSGSAPGGGDADGSAGQPIGSGFNAVTSLDGTGGTSGTDGSTSPTSIGQHRDQSLAALRGLFPTNYVSGQVPFSMDDLVIESILGSQRGVAEASLTNALKRGQISDLGFNTGLSTLRGQTEQGRSLYQKRGEDVLRGYRSDLQGIIDDAFTTAGSLPTTDTPFNAQSYMDNFNTRKSDLFGRMEGDIRSSISASSPFDPGKAISEGASASGPLNFLPDVLSRRGRGASVNDRGLGTRGVF